MDSTLLNCSLYHNLYFALYEGAEEHMISAAMTTAARTRPYATIAYHNWPAEY